MAPRPSSEDLMFQPLDVISSAMHAVLEMKVGVDTPILGIKVRKVGGDNYIPGKPTSGKNSDRAHEREWY